MPNETETDGLTLLGSGSTSYAAGYDPGILETFANRLPDVPVVVELACPEFTSLCPKTGQPDFASVTILYEPRGRLVESKSLKLYLFGFRQHGAFHEDVVRMIARDLFDAMAPAWVEVRGDFNPRGGISINPVCRLEAGPEG